MTTRPEAGTIGLHPAVVILVCALTTAAGVALGLGADMLLSLSERWLGGAPGPLRIAAQLPDGVTIAVLGVAGLVAGVVVIGRWEEETMVSTIGADGVRVRQHKRSRWVDRSRVDQVYLDGSELVLADPAGRALAVGTIDGVGRVRVARAFRDAGWPWQEGGSPHESRMRVFVDGRDELGEPETRLLAARATAIADGDAARARELREELHEAGLLVRDRRGEQEYVRP